MKEANKFLEKTSYWTTFNQKFSIRPSSQEDAHKNIPPGCILDEILCFKETRVVTKNLEFQYNNTIYQVLPEDQTRRLQGVRVTVIQKLDGSIQVEYKGQKIHFKEYCKQICSGQEVDSKEIDRFLKEKLPRVVPNSHPWKRMRSYVA